MEDSSPSRDVMCPPNHSNHRMNHRKDTVTYHFNPTEKHSLVRKHVVHRIQTAIQHSHKSKSTSPLSLTPIQTSALSSGGLPSPPVEADHDQVHSFSAKEQNHLVVSPTPTPTEEIQKDNRFTSELVAHALQKLSNKQACLTNEDLNGSCSKNEVNEDTELPDVQDTELLDEQVIRQKIADLTAEKHRLFQLMKSKIQDPAQEESSYRQEQEALPACETSLSSSSSSNDNEKENSRIERSIDRSSHQPTTKSSSPSPSGRPPMYRSRPLSDRGYYHHHFHAPPPLPPRSMYGPSYRVSFLSFMTSSPHPCV